MKNSKKIVTIALTTALVFGCTAPVWAGEPDSASTQPMGALTVDAAVQEQEQNMRYTSSVGTVKEINNEGTAKTILVETAQGEKVFYINDNPATDVPNTYLLDSNGLPTTLDALQGKEVRVAHSMAATFSLPPKSNAYAVMEIGDVVPNYAVVEAVQQNDDGSVTLTTDNGGMWVTVTKDAEVTPYLTKNRVTLADLQPGAEVVLYYDIVMESYPGQAGTDKVILLQAAPEVMDAPTVASTPVQQQMLMNAMTTVGTVQEIGQSSVLVKNDQTEIRFNIGEDTWLVDGQKGIPLDLQDLRGKEVVVSHSMAMTKSLPPQSYAYAIITKGDVTPNFAVVEEVADSENGVVRLTTNNGGMWVTVAEDADIKPLRTKNIVTAQDLQKGAQVLLYYDIVALSYPGQAYTDRVVLLQPADEQETAVNEDVMVSLRDAAGQLGLQLTWNGELQTVVLSRDGYQVTISIGSTKYGYSKTVEQDGEPTTIMATAMAAQAPELRDGRTYVPQSLVDALQKQLQP